MLEQLQAIEKKYEDLERRMADPEVLADQERLQKVAKAHAELEGAVRTYRRYREVLSGIDDARSILSELEGKGNAGRDSSDSELLELAKEELESLNTEKGSSAHRSIYAQRSER